jgi:hypothetical protein
MKVIYRTKLSRDEILTRLSENTEEEGFFFTKKNVLIGEIREENDTFEIKKLLSSVETQVEIVDTITKIDGGSLIEIQIYTGGHSTLYKVVTNFIFFVAVIVVIITHWNEYIENISVLSYGILFVFWVFNLCEVDDAADIIKRELKEILDAEIE